MRVLKARRGRNTKSFIEKRLFEDMSMDTKCEPRSKRSDIPALTGIRFVAAIYVVLFHAWPVFMPSRPGGMYWNQFVNLGYTAVSFFFVLSGFILATVYLKGDATSSLDKRHFWVARVARIYPVYLLSLVVSAPFALANGGQHDGLYRAVKSFFLILSNGALLQAWHPALSGNWNRPCWSVSVEAFFYLIFPWVGSWIAQRRGRAASLAAVSWVIGLGGSTLGLWVLRDMKPSLPNLELFLFNPILRVPEFTLGICCALIVPGELQSRLLRYLSLGVVVALVAVPLASRLPWLVVSNGLLSPLFGILVLSLSRSTGVVSGILGHRFFVRLGEASFSLYLFHLPILSWMSLIATRGTLADRMRGHWPLGDDAPIYLLIFMVLCISASLVSYSLIEVPARKTIKTWFSRAPQPSRYAIRAAAGVLAKP